MIILALSITWLVFSCTQSLVWVKPKKKAGEKSDFDVRTDLWSDIFQPAWWLKSMRGKEDGYISSARIWNIYENRKKVRYVLAPLFVPWTWS